MPKATKQHSASRRTLLSGIAAATVARPAMATSPDAALIALVDELEAVDDRADQISAPYYEQLGAPPKAIQDESATLMERYMDLLAQIGREPASTLEGYRAKARAAMRQFDMDLEKRVPEGRDEYVSWSLCRDILDGAA